MKLLKLALLLTVLNAGLIMLPREIAIRVPDTSPFAQAFSAIDGTQCNEPCLLGVRVGTTRFNDMRAIFAAHSITHSADIQLATTDILQAIQHGDNSVFMARCCGLNGSVSQVSWFGTAANSHYRFADAIRLLGPPDCLENASGSYGVNYTRLHINLFVVGADRQRLTLDDAVVLIVVYSQVGLTPCGQGRCAALARLQNILAQCLN